MARAFTKNVANYLSLGVNGLEAKIGGLAKFSIACWAQIVGTLDTTANNNLLLSGPDVGSTVGFSFGVNGVTVGSPKVEASARSVSTDGRQTKVGATAMSTSAWFHAGVVYDFTNKTITIYANGAADGALAATWANTTYTVGTPTGADVIGGFAAPPTTLSQFPGNIAELAIYNDDIGAANFAALAAGYSPELIAPAKLIDHFPLLGLASPEPSTRSTLSAAITGSLPQAAHPRILRP